MAMRSLTGRSIEVDVTALVMVNVFSTPINMSRKGRISLVARTCIPGRQVVRNVTG